MDTNLKIKNDRPDGAGIRIQAWDGVIPTYDSEEQRANALGGAKATDIDALKTTKKAEKDVVEKLPEGYDKLKKAELVELLETRKKMGHAVELDEADTVAILREKIEATYPEVIGDDEEKEPEAPPPVDTKPKPAVETKYDFKAGNLLQEVTLASNEEKTITVSSGHFLTIKIDE